MSTNWSSSTPGPASTGATAQPRGVAAAASRLARWFTGLPLVGKAAVVAAAALVGLWLMLTALVGIGVALTVSSPGGVEPTPGAEALAASEASPSPPSPSPSTVSPSPAAPPTTVAPVPVVRVELESVVEAVPFEEVTREDPGIDRGETRIDTVGQDGERTLTYEVTYTDGEETSRELVDDTVTLEPVDKVVLVGTRDPAPPPEPAAPADDCDPNYAGACVPIASDVDCAGGSGNGPEYVTGPVTVVGEDVYGLDGNGDGTGCE